MLLFFSTHTKKLHRLLKKGSRCLRFKVVSQTKKGKEKSDPSKFFLSDQFHFCHIFVTKRGIRILQVSIRVNARETTTTTTAARTTRRRLETSFRETKNAERRHTDADTKETR